MSENRFTPGPWRIDGGAAVESPDATLYVEIEVIPGEDASNDIEAELANARLISAAPDLYEIVRLYVEEDPPWPDLMEKARRALAKARGEEPGT